MSESTKNAVVRAIEEQEAFQSLTTKEFAEKCLSEGAWKRSEIIEGFMSLYPDRAKSTIQTYLSDALNRKYTAFDRLATVDKKDGTLKFTKTKVVYNYYRPKPAKKKGK